MSAGNRLCILGCFGLFGGLAMSACYAPADSATMGRGESAQVPLTINNAVPAGRSDEIAPYIGGDSEEIIRHDFNSAMNENTERALRLFIRYHPSHPLSAQVQKRLDECFPKVGQAPATCPDPSQ